MKLIRKRLNQAGNILLLSLVSTAIVGIMLAAYLKLVNSQNQSVARSQIWNTTIPVIEAGIEEAMTYLNGKGMTNMLADAGWSQVGTKYVLQRAIGDGYYNVCVYNYIPGGSNQTPIIESRAFVPPPVTVASIGSPFSGSMLAAINIPTTPTGLMGRGVRGTAGTDSLYAKGLVAKGKIDMKGNSISTDSFNSLPTSTNNTLGKYDATKALAHGDVATDDTVTNSVSVGNANINGSVATGPKGTVYVGPTGYVSGKITDDMNVAFDPVTVPFASGGYQTSDNGGATVGGVAYTATYTGGNYKISSFSYSGIKKILISGVVSIWLPNGLSLSGSAEIDIAPGASLTVYSGGDVSIGGNGLVNPNDATGCTIKGLPTCTSINFGGNAAYTGTIYAPSADLAMGGGGATTVDFIGASISNTVTMNGHFNFHYDEALRSRGPIKGYVLTSWNEMAPAEVRNVPGSTLSLP